MVKPLSEPTRIPNPFEKILFPNCQEREARFNRGCYTGFEKYREELKKQAGKKWIEEEGNSK